MSERADKQPRPAATKKPSAAPVSEKSPVFDVQPISNPLLDLQGTIGNQGVQRLLAQRKLDQLQSHRLLTPVIGNQAMRRLLVQREEVGDQFYAHGGFMGAARKMLNDSKWRSILETLMPDVYSDVKDVTNEGKLIPKLENNPVMAAYGMIATQQLDQKNEGGRSDRIQNMEALEWDVWLDSDTIRAYSMSFDDTTEAALDADLLDTMIIAHGNTKQTFVENVIGYPQYDAVKDTRKANLGGARSTTWMDLFGRALQIATSENPQELLDRMRGEPRHKDKDDQSLYQTFKSPLQFNKVLEIYKNTFGKDNLSVLLDIKSRNAKPWVLKKLIAELNRRGVHVYGVGTFEFSELNSLDEIDQKVNGKSMGAPKGIKFFHGIGNLQTACVDKEVFKDDHVMFNAGSILDSVDWDADKPDADDAAIESIIQRLGEFKKIYGFHLGLYVQEGSTDKRAAQKITAFSNQHKDIFDMGFSWGGMSNDMGPVTDGGSGMGKQDLIPWNEWDEDEEPGEPASSGFDSTFSIKRFLESRHFEVKRGRVLLDADAEWDKEDAPADSYTITLRQSDWFRDTTYQRYRFKVGERGTARWDGLEEGTYYVEIDVADQDKATLEGDLNVRF